MANLNITNIPAPRVPFIDERTGLMAREWYRFFLNLFVLTGSGNNPITLEELQLGPPNQPDLTELLIQINQNIAPQYEDQSGDFLATLDTAQLMSMMSRFENAEAAIQGAYLQPVVQTGTIANYNLDGSPTAGGVAYGTGPALAVSAAGTVGQVLTSGGAGAPTWATDGGGTVTSVAALTLGTSGTDLSSTVANGTTTPVITLQVPTASASNRGALSAADWTTFNSKGSGSVTSVAQSFTGGLISVAGSPITSSGTLALTVAGTSGGIPYFSSASAWASSAALAAGSLVLGGGAGATPATTATGTGVVTALGVNTGTAGAFVVNGGALGTPSSGTVTNLTGTASININGTVGATTPTTGAFTSGTFSTTLGVTGVLTQGNGKIYIPAYDGNAFALRNAALADTVGNYGLVITAAGAVGVNAVTGQEVKLHVNNSAVLTASSTGVTITGTLGVTGITTVAAGTAALPAIVSTTGTADTGLWFPAADTLAVSTSGAECMRITSDGRMRFISSSAYTGQQDARIQWVNENSAGVMAQISCVREAYPAAPGALAFYTSPNVDTNGYSPFERMRIDSAGIVTMSVYGAGAATFSAAGVISSVSDETWKTKDGIPTDPDAMLQKLAPGYWYYNDEKKETFGTDRQLGFYAQNVNAAIGPEAAPEPEEGKPWGYYDRSVLAVTVMSLQKALLAIEQLTAKVAALENQLRVST